MSKKGLISTILLLSFINPGFAEMATIKKTKPELSILKSKDEIILVEIAEKRVEIACYGEDGKPIKGDAIYLYNKEIGAKTLLVAPYGPKYSLHGKFDGRRIISKITKIELSSDKRYLYYSTIICPTEEATRRFDFKTKKDKFICYGGLRHVVQNGRFKDHVIVYQHRYFLGGGSYDWDYLYSPQGKEEGILGESTDEQIAKIEFSSGCL